MTEYKSNASKLIAADITSAADAQDLFDAIYSGIKASRTDQAMLTLSACRSLRIMRDGGMSQVNIKTSFPKSASYVSKGDTVTSLFADIKTGNVSDAAAEFVQNLKTYANLAGATMSVEDMATNHLSDHGSDHAQAVEAIYNTFGSLEYVYNVAKGNRLHPDDPRNAQDDEPADEPAEDGDDEGEGDSPSQSWQEIVSKGVRRAREAGVADDDIATFVLNLFA